MEPNLVAPLSVKIAPNGIHKSIRKMLKGMCTFDKLYFGIMGVYFH